MDFSYAAVRAAATTVARHLPPTPMWSYPVLNGAVGATVLVKHENTQPVGAFKARGALNLLSSAKTGTVTYSTGNHAQSMAWASHLFGLPCTVVMPEDANPSKVAAVRAWGAEVVLAGSVLADSEAYAVELATRTGHRLVSPGDTPELLAGVGTLYEEIFTARPDVDAILVPVGSGTGAAAAAVVARELAPKCEVIGVQSASSPAAHDSWRSGDLATRPNRTRIEGLATGRGYYLPQRHMRDLADFLLVDDDRIAEAQRLLATAAHTLAEGAGAAGLAALLDQPDRFAGRTIAIVCTGGNASPRELAALQ
ncbi:threonine ammonia-lyase [Paractinoplanes hotanensis]|uniref:Pyridoxal-phosphate dependent enzyme n=1 Tax=Paractinoplanes hotanensis TaxID=2906497 RepID=A0ABT0YC78_9ACTN|nr:pyridoxal-phosphate dependent enzyme [Actinoplanes hotanensis]MCM4083653.1 pyridoxal-phosphate dependent enzyme [Actinoplanes hotanensis]